MTTVTHTAAGYL